MFSFSLGAYKMKKSLTAATAAFAMMFGAGVATAQDTQQKVKKHNHHAQHHHDASKHVHHQHYASKHGHKNTASKSDKKQQS
jgi:hypothetical protein